MKAKPLRPPVSNDRNVVNGEASATGDPPHSLRSPTIDSPVRECLERYTVCTLLFNLTASDLAHHEIGALFDKEGAMKAVRGVILDVDGTLVDSKIGRAHV